MKRLPVLAAGQAISIKDLIMLNSDTNNGINNSNKHKKRRNGGSSGDIAKNSQKVVPRAATDFVW